MSKIFHFLFCVISLFINAQVGINTEIPQATLDVVGKPNDPTHFDGIIPPRITGDLLSAKIYSLSKKGAVVYVLNSPQNRTGQVINIIEPGLYYFDGNIWQSFAKEMDPIEYRISLTFDSENDDPLAVTSNWSGPIDYYGNNNREYLVSKKSYSIGTKSNAGLKGDVVFSKINGFTNVNFQIYRSNDSTLATGKVFIDITRIFNDIGYVPYQIVLLHTENSTDFFPALLENNAIQIPQTTLNKISAVYYTRGEAQGFSHVRKPGLP